jgi:uncharacterized protein with HEPN domain
MVNRDELYLTVSLESIETIEKYLSGKSLNFLFSSGLYVDAISKQLEEIGENIRKISVGLKRKYPKVKWQEFLDARNFLSHVYQKTSVPRIWKMCKEDLPILKKQLLEILKNGEKLK